MKTIEPKILKGTRDFLPLDMIKRNIAMDKIKSIFDRCGYNAISTPIICPAETILGKYGDEGERLTYSFEDNGGRHIALPYDLTVPLARFVASNWSELPMPFKRYQIQRVWRAEKPQKGRLREFYQCDIDIVGSKSLICEAEIARVIIEVFKSLDVKDFKIKVNSRRLINAVLDMFNVPQKKHIDVIRSVDKLEKIGEQAVEKEIEALEVKDADKMLALLKPAESNKETLEKLEQYDTEEIKTFLKYSNELSVSEKYLQFDPSLARGLDYYTGIIYEVVSKQADFGTICAGGRYDDLCSLFGAKDLSGVGVSFGFERIMILLEEMGIFKNTRLNSQVLVTLFDENSTDDALNIYSDLLDKGINSEIYFEPAKLAKQLKYADKKKIQFVVISGSQERESNTITIKTMESGKQKTIPRKQLTSYLSGFEKK
ncbi:MAG: histidine--tRNA ligase [bacterium]